MSPLLRCMILAPLAAGCGERVTAPTPWIYEAEPAPPPSLGVDELAAAIEAALAEAAAIDVAPLHDAWQAMTLLREPGCPALLEGTAPEEVPPYWQGDCTTAGGTAFSGYALRYPYDGYVDDSGGVWAGWLLDFAGAVEAADGRALRGAGTLTRVSAELPDYRYWQHDVEGTWQAEGVAEGSFAARGERPSIRRAAVLFPELDARAMSLSGALSAGGVAVSFDANLIRDAAAGGCPLEPGGTIAVRDPDGGWFEVAFDGPPDWETQASGGCDGCGAATWSGEAIGQVCVDFSSLLAWDAAPW